MSDNAFLQMISSLNAEVVASLRRAVELGKFPDGRRLTEEEQALCMQAVIVWEKQSLPEDQRTGYIDRGSKAEGERCDDGDSDHDHEAPVSFR